MNHIMIDIETTDTRFTAGVLSIRAVKFNIDTGETGETFYRRLGYDQAAAYGTVDPGTLAWWQRQDAAVREQAFTGEHDCFITAAELADFCQGARGVWGNGAVFDLGILDHWYAALGSDSPWGFNSRCLFTIKDFAKIFGLDKKQWTRHGDHHNAVDDAIYQAQYLSGMWQEMKPVRYTIEQLRADFERIFSAMPYEFNMTRNGSDSAWPDNYTDYNVQCAWCGYYQAACTAGLIT